MKSMTEVRMFEGGDRFEAVSTFEVVENTPEVAPGMRRTGMRTGVRAGMNMTKMSGMKSGAKMPGMRMSGWTGMKMSGTKTGMKTSPLCLLPKTPASWDCQNSRLQARESGNEQGKCLHHNSPDRLLACNSSL